MEKIKVSSAEIVVHGTRGKPYYEIKYHDLSDGQCHVGYSSYNLDFVFEWLEECFEIVNEAADTIESLYAKLQAANMERSVDCDRWIPCSTGNMPDMGSTVLIQFESDMDGITGNDDRTFDISFIRSRDNSEWFCSTGEYPLKAVKAWKPIKAYHEP